MATHPEVPFGLGVAGVVGRDWYTIATDIARPAGSIPSVTPSGTVALRSLRIRIDPRAVRFGLIAAGILVSIALWRVIVFDIPNGGDGWSYWQAPYAHPYDRATRDELLSYLYSPAFLQAIAPLKALPFEAFNAVWVALLLAVAVVTAGPLAFAVLLLPPVLQELEVGNVHLLLGLMVAVSFRWPAAQAFGLLTKVTPGVALIWFAVRRQWRAVAIALGVTGAIVACSVALAPELWGQWLVVFGRPTVRGGAALIPLALRAPAAAILVAYAARTNRAWLVPIAVTLTLPNLWFNGLAVLIGALPLLPWERLPAPLAAALRPIFDGRPSRAER
jgi:hypothetical protein